MNDLEKEEEYLRYAVQHGGTLRMMAHDLGISIAQVWEKLDKLKEKGETNGNSGRDH